MPSKSLKVDSHETLHYKTNFTHQRESLLESEVLLLHFITCGTVNINVHVVYAFSTARDHHGDCVKHNFRFNMQHNLVTIR